VDLLNLILTDDPNLFTNVLHSFVSIAAVQVALTDLLSSVGIVADGFVGHSVGELGCAYADGAFTAEQAVLAAYWRGRAILESTLSNGLMAAVGKCLYLFIYYLVRANGHLQSLQPRFNYFNRCFLLLKLDNT